MKAFFESAARPEVGRFRANLKAHCHYPIREQQINAADPDPPPF
jgi:hypothetical protein